MPRDQNIQQAKVVLEPIMGAMRVDNADTYQGVNACLIDFGNSNGRVERIRIGAGYDHTSMLAWGARAVAERGGNCDDFAAAVCYLLRHNGFHNIFLEHVQAPGHAFVVVNRNVNLDINDASSWTNETFIIDYWLRCRPGSRQIITVHVPADLLCDIPATTEQRVVSSNPADVNPFITDMTAQPGLWYAGHRANRRLKSMTCWTLMD